METPREIAERLAETALGITPSAFAEILNSTLAKTADIDVQSRLLWVAGMFLDRHPEAFQLPRSLGERLLASADYDHVLAGLKAIRHSGAAPSGIIACFMAVMQRTEWDERYAGLHQLNNLLIQLPQIADGKTVELGELRSVLTQIADSAPDEHARECATLCIARLSSTA